MGSLLTICSTRQRPARCSEMIDSYEKTTSSKSSRLVVYVWEKDPSLSDYQKIKITDPRVTIEYGKDRSMVDVLNYFSTAKYPDMDYYSEVNDDHVFVTPGWDKAMMDAIDRKNNGFAIAYGWTDGFPTATMHGGKVVRALGYFFPKEYLHTCVDLWLEEIHKGTDILVHLPHVMIEHKHPIFKKADWDTVYRESSDNELPLDKKVFDDWCIKQKESDIAFIKSFISENRVFNGSKTLGAITEPLTVFMTTYDRIELLERTVESYLHSDRRPKQFWVFDDGSKKFDRVKALIMKIPEAILIQNERNHGSDGNIIHAQRRLFEAGAKNILALDSDCLFDPRWYRRALDICTYINLDRTVMCLFNARVHKADPCPISGFVLKEYIGGLGILLSKHVWEKYVVPIELEDMGGWDGKVCKRAASDGCSVLATTPSMLQHTGSGIGVHANVDATDCIADDFEGDRLGQKVLQEFSRSGIKNRQPTAEEMSKFRKFRLPEDFGPNHPFWNQPSYQQKYQIMLKETATL
jgi:hypothetical protein